jgi:neutral ceramidase
MTFPYKWHPDIIDTQLLQIGNVVIAALPGEFTTMAGR